MTRRELLGRLAWLPLLGPALHRWVVAPQAPVLPQVIRQGLPFTEIGRVLTRGPHGGLRVNPEFFPGTEWRMHFYENGLPLMGPGVVNKGFQDWPLFALRARRDEWVGWLENEAGQVIGFVQRNWSVWGTP